MDWWVFAIIGYFCGSIPFGLLFTRAAGLGDVRDIGSGSIGATNVLRTGNKKIAALTLLMDLVKGLFPILLAKHYGGAFADVAAGIGAMAGHIFPIWLKFKGGKGVATGLGVLLGWSWIVALAAFAIWVLIFFLTRISSAAGLSSAVAAVIFTLLIDVAANGQDTAVVWPVVALAFIVFVMHRANIVRLLRGEEPKSSFSKKA